MTSLLHVQDLSFSYRKRLVLSQVSFDADNGVTALLGPNGAGKSTLFNCIIGSLKLRSGAVTIAPGQKIGYIPQSSQMPAGSTVWQVLHYAAWLRGHTGTELAQCVKRTIETLNLTPLLKRRVRTLSGGERQRIAIAVGIIDNPQVLLLDEPTVGLDPAHRFHLREIVAELSKNRCVLLSTHLIEDVYQIANRIVLLSGGTSFFTGTIPEFVHRFTEEASVTTSAIERAYDAAITASMKVSQR